MKFGSGLNGAAFGVGGVMPGERSCLHKKTKEPTQRCHFALGLLGALGTCTIASGVQSLNCADPGKPSKLGPEAPEGCALHRFSCRFRICR
eukprot:8945762-Alexandrium_andersonii.AAC.1